MTRKKIYRHVSVVLCCAALLPLLVMCKKKKSPTVPEYPGSTFDEKALLSQWANEIVTAEYEQYETKSKTLNEKTQAFISNPDASSLGVLQSAFVEAYSHWQFVSLYEFGPASDISLVSNTNIFPTDDEEIENSIKRGDYDLTAASKLDEKGFPAIDYLLYHKSIIEVVAAFSTDSLAANRKNYLHALTTEIQNNATHVRKQWKGDYSSTFIENTGKSSGASLALMLNAINAQYERHLRDAKVGIPNGVRTFNGAVLPDHVEAYYSKNISRELLKLNLLSLKNWYMGVANGSDGLGLDDYLVSKANSSLNSEVLAQFSVCEERLSQLTLPLQEAVQKDKENVDKLYKALQKMATLLKVEIPAAIEVVITYKDSDGD